MTTLPARFRAFPAVFALACASTAPPDAAPPAAAPPATTPAAPPAPAARPTMDEATRAALVEALAGTHRAEADKARDAQRHPLETLAFLGLRRDMTVVELAPGGGWYTDVLAPVLKGHGKLYAAHAEKTRRASTCRRASRASPRSSRRSRRPTARSWSPSSDRTSRRSPPRAAPTWS